LTFTLVPGASTLPGLGFCFFTLADLPLWPHFAECAAGFRQLLAAGFEGNARAEVLGLTNCWFQEGDASDLRELGDEMVRVTTSPGKTPVSQA
jgi:hypothetical protein